MSDDASVRQNATAALVGAIAGYLVHGHWPVQAAKPVIESVLRWLVS